MSVGITDAGAVNKIGGYVAGATNIFVDGLVGVVVAGQTFLVTGETGAPVHTVTGHTETSGNTTSVSFTPALAADVADDAVVTFSPDPTGNNSVELKIGEGTLSYSEKRNMEYRRDRGVLNTVREGDEEPVDVSFDFEWEFLRSSTGEPVTIEEALKQEGAAVDWVSSSADICEPYCVDIVIEYIPPCSDADTEIIILQDFRWESMDHNLRDSQVSVSGKCNIKQATITRVAQASVEALLQQSRDSRMNDAKRNVINRRAQLTEHSKARSKAKSKSSASASA